MRKIKIGLNELKKDKGRFSFSTEGIEMGDIEKSTIYNAILNIYLKKGVDLMTETKQGDEDGVC